MRFTYDRGNRITGWTDTNGHGYSYTHDDRDRCVAQGGEAGHLTFVLDYEATHADWPGMRVTKHTSPEGIETQFVVNDALEVVAEIDPLGSVTRTEYDERHNIAAWTDPLGNTTRIERNAAGQPVTVTLPDGGTTHYAYNALALPTRITLPDGSTWRRSYDKRGNCTRITDPTGATTYYAFDSRGNLASVTDPLGASTRVDCDDSGLPITLTDPLGHRFVRKRDAFGRVSTIVDPLGATTHLQWTVEGRIARATGPDGAERSWTYDGEGNRTSHTDANGISTTYTYSHFDLLTAQNGPGEQRYEFEHDTSLRLTKVTNEQGLSWEYEYDAAGRIVAERDFDGRRVTYEHDAAGRMVARTNPLGETVTYRHDPLDRITAVGVAGAVTTFEHDPLGNLLRAVNADYELVRERDAAGRITAETVNGRTLTSGYDAAGRRVSRTTPTGARATYGYDAAGRRISVTTSGRTLTSGYDDAGHEISRQVGDLALTQLWGSTGRVTEQSLSTTEGGLLQRRAYTYRPDGHLTGIDDPLLGHTEFALDTSGRVTEVSASDWTESYAYDSSGNQASASWPGQERDDRVYTGTRLTGARTMRYEYDGAGRIVVRRKTRLSRKPETWRYTWDAEDRLTSVTTPDGTLWRYRYDPLGRRIAKQRMAPDGTTVLAETHFTWDGSTVTEQTTTAPDFPHPVTLTWDHDGLRPVAQTERRLNNATQEEIDSRFFAIVTDIVGTPTELADESGTIAWRARRTLWGVTSWRTDSTAYTPLRFPGQYHDLETGLHYNYFRYYDPETARYLSSDPLGLAPAPNPYTYVHNPHSWSDPLGLTPCPNDVALGIREHGLREFADRNNFTHYLDDLTTWEAEVRAAAHNPNVRLHVVMDGFRGETPSQRFMNAYEEGMGDNWYATEREMYHVGESVRRESRTWDSITFYENGQRVSVPEPSEWPRPPEGRRR
ncbi:RHS repeat-associated core domain-containing protein [Streptomyces sp. DSM 44938]|uniref:RHS repeat-associated core domain-containing protein n=1 Tax=Streptomyces litchfieldiae TaxID=3075543 RepID=A0ABU2MMR4_9ACTN|nr:RHS repeat-associated core domain-containing protein [Streptomyces sp. DSM 44938]MDT0342903.1 RHS repeat-associated core domain-containing protein [Streptomyces sp. DSM 44938]